MYRRHKGFTLIEILIAIVIIGTLTAIALPNYTQYMQRSKRTEAEAVLMEAQQFMQRLYMANNSYLVAGAQPVLPTPMRTAPMGSALPNYNIAVVATATTYTLTATPRAGGPMATDACASLSINQRNAKSTSSGTMSAADCWR